MHRTDEVTAELLAFIDASPSPFHACATAAARLEAAGFTKVEEVDAWPGGHGGRYLIRDGSLVAWKVPEDATPGMPFRIVGAHTDSPNLRIKPRPDTGLAGARQLEVEVYGGALLNSWLDRDLGLSGRVALRTREGQASELRLVLVNRPVLRVPQLAIHLDRDITATGLLLNPQQHLTPLWGVGAAEPDGFRRFLASELDVDPADVRFWDVMTHDLQPSCTIGVDNELISAPRIDNLCSAWASIDALTNATPTDTIPVVSLFDHEEIGSATNRGAGSSMLPTVLERISLATGADRDGWHRALAGSVCVSADGAHATHPNYPERHDPKHWIALNGGPVVKTNVNGRYASDARSATVFLDACERAGVPVQHYSHRNDLPCGSTIGPITAARLGIPTVDVGAPQLAMHSARELMGAEDPALLAKALTAFLAPT
jgi:aspartyl aminopeptidase